MFVFLAVNLYHWQGGCFQGPVSNLSSCHSYVSTGLEESVLEEYEGIPAQVQVDFAWSCQVLTPN